MLSLNPCHSLLSTKCQLQSHLNFVSPDWNLSRQQYLNSHRIQRWLRTFTPSHNTMAESVTCVSTETEQEIKTDPLTAGIGRKYEGVSSTNEWKNSPKPLLRGNYRAMGDPWIHGLFLEYDVMGWCQPSLTLGTFEGLEEETWTRFSLKYGYSRVQELRWEEKYFCSSVSSQT